jgi:hypothetical protein
MPRRRGKRHVGRVDMRVAVDRFIDCHFNV